MSEERKACRILTFDISDGAKNMAADEVLLESAINGVASFRLYGWKEPTLSLGYFQPARLRDTDAQLAALPFVRRCTGGETLLHHYELTYALALPQGAGRQRRDRPWLCRMHSIIAAALAKLGVEVRVCCTGEEKRLGNMLCFLHQTPGDLLCGEAKVVGSAQRKQRGALLQHGAILLAQSPHAPALAGLCELAGFEVRRIEQLWAALLGAFSRDTEWHQVPSDFTASERTRIADLAESKYSRTSWNHKR